MVLPGAISTLSGAMRSVKSAFAAAESRASGLRAAAPAARRKLRRCMDLTSRDIVDQLLNSPRFEDGYSGDPSQNQYDSRYKQQCPGELRHIDEGLYGRHSDKIGFHSYCINSR